MQNPERVVGRLSPEEREGILEYTKQGFEDLRGVEREKTPEERALVERALDLVSVVRQQYGFEPAKIFPENYHVVEMNEEKLHEINAKPFSGLMQSTRRRMLLERSQQRSRFGFLESAVHEGLHLSSYGALQGWATEDKLQFGEYRRGVTVTSRDGTRRFFQPLDEAVTTELSKPVLAKEFAHNPILREEYERVQKLRPEALRILQRDDEVFFDDDLIDVRSEEGGYYINRFSYAPERMALRELCQKIAEVSSAQYESPQAVFDEFVKAYFSGHLLTVGKSIDRTFGKGSFRRLGEAKDGEELTQVIQSFKQ